jgi:hypothetical protein
MKKLNITKFGFIGIISPILFSVLLFGFLLDNKANAQTDINWSIRADSVATGATDGVEYYSLGVPNNIRDNDGSTFYGNGCSATFSEYGGCWWEYWASVTFSQPTRINKAEIYHEGLVDAGAGSYASLFWYVDLYYGGAWNNVISGTATGVRTDSNSTGWDNVTTIRVRANGHAVLEMGPGARSSHGTFELRAWGPPPYIDCGLRIRTETQTLAIACQPAGILTSPLRIRKGATTYGIVLVATTDGNASPIRIKTSSGIKALRKY